MLSVNIIVASLIAGIATADPVAMSPRADCSTIFSGYLAANATGNVLKTFTENAENQVAYLGDGKNPIQVDFQECESLESGEPVNSGKSGVIYVPLYAKCISITNQENAAGPYYTSLADCAARDYAQRWNLDEANSNVIRWAGDSDEEGTILQGGCGLLGYASDDTGVPTITDSNSQINIVCGGTPLRLSSTAQRCSDIFIST
ncbi:hypothetical protein FIBSPDRAFT_896872 [Athelia psychrophila]|uniref:Uncharacterized protein n=1 Tax=Athelia psychrophila TaxID=1759441 RepID=A0A166CV52_9AGAM|nr:hypothetical protein FIBSPDRAFT_896872 [Fibularhizoctonia sp. CBS 109695]